MASLVGSFELRPIEEPDNPNESFIRSADLDLLPRQGSECWSDFQPTLTDAALCAQVGFQTVFCSQRSTFSAVSLKFFSIIRL